MLPEVYEIAGFFDPSDDQAREAGQRFGIQRFETVDDLLDAVDAVDIVTPTTTHFELADLALRRGKHVFIEKPVTQTLEQAEALLKRSRQTGLSVQVGHVERFNPALLSLRGMDINPMFIEAHRLSMFNPRGTDVSVILDLMIHDLDIIASMVRSRVTSVSASGVAVVSQTPDICNARLEFENGCVANLTASRISLKQMRKIRLFQKDAYISLDFLEKKAQVVRLYDEEEAGQLPPGLPVMEMPTATGSRYISIESPEMEPGNAIKMELESFAQSIQDGTPPPVSLQDGYEALQLAYRVTEEIDQRLAAFRTI